MVQELWERARTLLRQVRLFVYELFADCSYACQELASDTNHFAATIDSQEDVNQVLDGDDQLAHIVTFVLLQSTKYFGIGANRFIEDSIL